MYSGLILGSLFLIGLLSWFIWDKRYRHNTTRELPQDYIKTEEVFIDPVDGRKLRVYYNPETGDRHYVSAR